MSDLTGCLNQTTGGDVCLGYGSCTKIDTTQTTLGEVKVSFFFFFFF